MTKKIFLYKLFFIALIPAVLFLFYNQKTNTHYHILDNGQVIEHSHPYKNSATPGSPYQEHEHSSSELIFLSLLSEITGAFILLAILISALNKKLVFYISQVQDIYVKSVYLLTDKKRGPPVTAF